VAVLIGKGEGVLLEIAVGSGRLGVGLMGAEVGVLVKDNVVGVLVRFVAERGTLTVGNAWQLGSAMTNHDSM
jgi:hypothetical protein